MWFKSNAKMWTQHDSLSTLWMRFSTQFRFDKSNYVWGNNFNNNNNNKLLNEGNYSLTCQFIVQSWTGFWLQRRARWLCQVWLCSRCSSVARSWRSVWRQCRTSERRGHVVGLRLVRFERVCGSARRDCRWRCGSGAPRYASVSRRAEEELDEVVELAHVWRHERRRNSWRCGQIQSVARDGARVVKKRKIKHYLERNSILLIS